MPTSSRPFTAALAAVLLAGCTSPVPESPTGDAPTQSASGTARPDGTAPGDLDEDRTDWRAFFLGEWTGDDATESAPGLGCPKVLTVDVEATQVLCVVPNQIWITARWEIDEVARRASLFLVGPDDLGSFGQQLPWDAFSRDAPIATLEPDLGEGRSVVATWHGFRSDAGDSDDFGRWYDGSYSPADGDTRIPTR